MIILNNEKMIPELGLGTCFGSPEEMHQAVQWEKFQKYFF
jgi:hypothetical protein